MLLNLERLSVIASYLEEAGGISLTRWNMMNSKEKKDYVKKHPTSKYATWDMFKKDIDNDGMFYKKSRNKKKSAKKSVKQDDAKKKYIKKTPVSEYKKIQPKIQETIDEELENEKIDTAREVNRAELESNLQKALKDKSLRIEEQWGDISLTNKSGQFKFNGLDDLKLIDDIANSDIVTIDGDMFIDNFDDIVRFEEKMIDKVVNGKLILKKDHNDNTSIKNLPSCDELILDDCEVKDVISEYDIPKMTLEHCAIEEINVGSIETFIANKCNGGDIDFGKDTKITGLCAINYSNINAFDGHCLSTEGVELDLHGCYNLTRIDSLPSNITNLDITGCRQLDIDDIENLDGVLNNIRMINGTVFCSDCDEELQEYIKSKLDPMQVIATTIEDF